MKIRRTMQVFLRDAWHGPLPLRAIVKQTKLGESTVRDFWAGLKAAKILPDGPRPYFVKVTAPPPAPANDDDLGDEVDVTAAPPAAVEVLRQHHPQFAHPAFASVGAHLLRIEDRRPVGGPTPFELREAARAYDECTRPFA